MIALVVVGAALGAAAVLALWSLVPARVSIPVQLARFDARASTEPDGGHAPLGPLARARARVGHALVLRLARHGIIYRSLHQDLALTGHTVEEVMAAKLLAFVTGVVAVVASAVAVRAGTGLTVPLLSPAVLALGVGTGLFFVPDLAERREAAARRREFRRALGAWLDLVALEMAGSAAPAEALPSAARVGTSWPMVVLGDTLTARAASMRRALLAEAESQAGRQDQSMLVAQILIGFGFIVFLMYPAVVTVMAI